MSAALDIDSRSTSGPAADVARATDDRQQLERELFDADHEMRRRRLYEATFDPRRELRVFALERLREIAPNDALRLRVEQLAATDPDSVVRGYARLLAAEWRQHPQGNVLQGRGLPPVVRPPSFDAKFDAGIGRSDFAAPPGGGIALAGFESPLDANSSNAYGTPGFYGAPDVDSVSDWPDSFDNRLGPRNTPPQGSFADVSPFWLPSASVSSLPSDVARSESAAPFQMSSFVEPPVLDRPFDAPPDENVFSEGLELDGMLNYPIEAPLGFTGPSGVMPTELQENSHFVPLEDRWRLGFPAWDRYGLGFPFGEDYPYKEGRLLDPYNLNVLKGDYPIIGQHTFLSLTGTSFMLQEYRQTPTATTPFESTSDPFQEDFFGDPNQYFYSHFFRLAIDLFHGNAAFKPVDWRVKVEPVFNVNYLKVEELAVVNPDVRDGETRGRTDFALEEWFVEAKLADLGPDYDFASVRAGSQLFVSDFRGFVLKDINRGVRLFGTRFSNRDQFNLLWLDQTEKETNGMLNTFDDRHQNTVVANYFRQDFIFPGYTALLSFHYNRDEPSTEFDKNDFLVRPDPAGVFREHKVNAYYIGLGGDGHIGRFNISNQFYYVLGNDTLNPIGGCPQDIDAQMAAVELSYDRDWIRFRSSYFFASGDNNPNDKDAGGFDTILDDPVFAGGAFSYWQRQQIKLFGVNLVQRQSLVPNLRSSKFQGQSNFVNPGLQLINVGMDLELTPKLRAIANANYLWFDTVNVLRTFTFQQDIGRDIGTDLSLGMEWRPFLNDNVIIVWGSAVLIPARGLRDLFGTEVPPAISQLTGLQTEIPQFQQHFLEMALTY